MPRRTTNRTITLNASSSLVALNPSLVNDQQVCEQDAIQEIQYTTGSAVEDVGILWQKDIGDGNGFTPSGTPNGIQVNHDIDSNFYRIYGSPQANITTTTIYSFTLTPQGNSCENTPTVGSFTVFPKPSLEVDSNSATLYQNYVKANQYLIDMVRILYLTLLMAPQIHRFLVYRIILIGK